MDYTLSSHESDLNTAQEIPVKKFVFEKIATVLLLLLAAGVALGCLQIRTLSTDFAKCHDHVLLKPSEQSYWKIPWRTSILQGIVDAQMSDKPVMILLMNGHPLGCT